MLLRRNVPVTTTRSYTTSPFPIARTLHDPCTLLVGLRTISLVMASLSATVTCLTGPDVVRLVVLLRLCSAIPGGVPFLIVVSAL